MQMNLVDCAEGYSKGYEDAQQEALRLIMLILEQHGGRIFIPANIIEAFDYHKRVLRRWTDYQRDGDWYEVGYVR